MTSGAISEVGSMAIRNPKAGESMAEYVHSMWQQPDVIQAYPNSFARRHALEQAHRNAQEESEAKPEPLGLSTVGEPQAASEGDSEAEPAPAEDEQGEGGEIS